MPKAKKSRRESDTKLKSKKSTRKVSQPGFTKISAKDFDSLCTLILSINQIQAIIYITREQVSKDFGLRITDGRQKCAQFLTEPDNVHFHVLVKGLRRQFTVIVNDIYSFKPKKEDMKAILSKKWMSFK